MDSSIRFALYLIGFTLLVLANVWFLRSLRSSFSRGIVIDSFYVAGKENDPKIGDHLAHMLQVRLQQRAAEIEAYQNAILSHKPADSRRKQDRAGAARAFLPPSLLDAKSVAVETRLLDKVDIDVSLAGVQLGGFFSWLQRLMNRDHTLRCAVTIDPSGATFAATVPAAIAGKPTAIWKHIDGTSLNDITYVAADAILQAKLATDASNQASALKLEEFQSLVSILGETARLNHDVQLGRAAKSEFSDLVPKAEAITKVLPQWFEMTYLAASIADAADHPDAAKLYRAALDIPSKDIPAETQHRIEARIADLTPPVERSASDAEKAIMADAQYALQALNGVFQKQLTLPKFKLLPPDERNAYIDRNQYNAPAVVELLPDVTYHEMAWPFITQALPGVPYEGVAGSIMRSYADICSVYVKQQKSMTGTPVDWQLAPGGAAWVDGKNPADDRRPLFSLAEPGKAHPHDIQIANYSQLADPQNPSSMYINSGIGNKAFYETAVKIGTDKALRIWIDALPYLQKNRGNSNYPGFAAATIAAAQSQGAATAVMDAWRAVKVPLKQAKLKISKTRRSAEA